MLTQTVFTRFPRVPLWRRGVAFAIDFVAVWLVSSLLAPGVLFSLMFLLLWWLVRVVLVQRNHGQSPGRYALDMMAIDTRFTRVPDLLTLTKREGITGLGALWAAIGLNVISTNGAALVLFVPLALDCCLAWTENSQQAFHDRFAGTVVVGSRRGYSLDLKVKRLVAEATRRVRR